MSKHTPGPWHWWDINELITDTRGGVDELLAHRGEKDGRLFTEPVLKVNPHDGSNHDSCVNGCIEIATEDARLIAAAPALLEAAKALLNDHPDGSSDFDCEHFDNLRAAIAAAEGAE